MTLVLLLIARALFWTANRIADIGDVVLLSGRNRFERRRSRH